MRGIKPEFISLGVIKPLPHPCPFLQSEITQRMREINFFLKNNVVFFNPFDPYLLIIWGWGGEGENEVVQILLLCTW